MATFRKNIKPILDVRGDRTMIVMNSYRFGGEANLMGYWPFNGNANDESGNNNNGIVYGATLTTDRHSIPNRAYDFTPNNYIDVPTSDTLIFNNLPFSISFWFNLNDFVTEIFPAPLILKTNTSTGYYMFLGNSGGYIGFNFGSSSNFIRGRIIMSPTLTTWHHIVLMFNGVDPNDLNSYSVYYDNALIGLANSSSFLTITNITRIGYGLSALTWFDGKLDDIRIYNRILTIDEITALYNE